jgi:Acyl-CoA dehydrogenase, N-terminal domain
MVNTVRALAQEKFKPRVKKWQDGTFPFENIKDLADIGVLGMAVPEEYGGMGTPTRRVTLGAVGKLTPDEARKLAKTTLGAVAHGADDRTSASLFALPPPFKERFDAVLTFKPIGTNREQAIVAVKFVSGATVVEINIVPMLRFEPVKLEPNSQLVDVVCATHSRT